MALQQGLPITDATNHAGSLVLCKLAQLFGTLKRRLRKLRSSDVEPD